MGSLRVCWLAKAVGVYYCVVIPISCASNKRLLNTGDGVFFRIKSLIH